MHNSIELAWIIARAVMVLRSQTWKVSLERTQSQDLNSSLDSSGQEQKVELEKEARRREEIRGEGGGKEKRQGGRRK